MNIFMKVKIDTRNPGRNIFIEHGNNIHHESRVWLRGVIGKVFNFKS